MDTIGICNKNRFSFAQSGGTLTKLHYFGFQMRLLEGEEEHKHKGASMPL
jgi:hypothetical protein